MHKMTFTSDGFGSISTYDSEGRLERIDTASPTALYGELKYMVKEDGFGLEQALPFFTTNVAAGLNLGESKGRLDNGYDADILLVNEGLEIVTFIARGNVLKQDGNVVASFPFE
jgi:beta-aspartyl-dipeptidase (metallo-type)